MAEEVRLTKDDARDLLEMQGTPGWTVLDKYLRSRRNSCTRALEGGKFERLDDVTALQSAIREIDSTLRTVLEIPKIMLD
jgi:hypothetical protein